MKNCQILPICTFLISLSLYSCSEPQDSYDSIEIDEITLTKQMEVGGVDDLIIGNINQIEITENGQILLLDTQQKKIHLFKSNGDYIRSELSEGDGPGEVRQVGEMDYSNGLVQVYDWSQRKLSRYRVEYDTEDGNAQLLFTEDLRPEPYLRNFHITPNGTGYVIISPEPIDDHNEIRIKTISEDRAVVQEPVISFPNNEIIEVLNEQGRLMATFSSPHSRRIIPVFYENNLILGRSEQIGFEIYNLESGEKIDSVAYDRPNTELTSVEKRDFLKDMTERMGIGEADIASMISQMPDQKGKVRNMFYDPDRVIWLNLIRDDETTDVPEWLLLDDEGEFLGRITDELEGAVMAVNGGKVYVRESTEEGELFLSIYNYELPR